MLVAQQRQMSCFMSHIQVIAVGMEARTYIKSFFQTIKAHSLLFEAYIVIDQDMYICHNREGYIFTLRCKIQTEACTAKLPKSKVNAVHLPILLKLQS